VTHEVTNQPPPLTGSNAWRGDPLLIQIAEGFSAPVRKDLDMLGRFVLTAFLGLGEWRR
jgi:putative acyl-CoA dehydrogenase